MINNDRIVPIQKQDLITMYGTIINLITQSVGEDTIPVLEASTVDGAFSVTGTGDAGVKLANQPVQSLDFASGVTAGTVYFVAAYDFAGITVAGAAATFAEGSATVNPDGATLYTATLDSGTVTIAAVSPVVSA